MSFEYSSDKAIRELIIPSYDLVMNIDKQHSKLLILQEKAETCLSRKEAQKVIRKADKAHKKLSE